MESVDTVQNSSDRCYPQQVHNHHEYCFLIESINAYDTFENSMLKKCIIIHNILINVAMYSSYVLVKVEGMSHICCVWFCFTHAQ